MMHIEYLYAMQGYLNNLLMFKYLHDEGIDLSRFSDCRLSSYNEYSGSDNDSLVNFEVVAEFLFKDVIIYHANVHNFDDDDENYLACKEHWLQVVNASEKAEDSLLVAVILDSSLRNAITGSVGMSYQTGSCAEAYQIEDGVVIVYDTDYGEADWCEVMISLLESRRKHLAKEEQLNEMAI